MKSSTVSPGRASVSWSVFQKVSFAADSLDHRTFGVTLSERGPAQTEIGGLRDIGGDRDTIRVKLFLSVADGPRAAPGHDNVGALLDELPCGRETDPARAASDDDDFVREAALACLLLSPRRCGLTPINIRRRRR
jgi:hypothetical protein